MLPQLHFPKGTLYDLCPDAVPEDVRIVPAKRRQKVEIIFNFVDEVEIPVLAEPMIAESTLGRRKTA